MKTASKLEAIFKLQYPSRPISFAAGRIEIKSLSAAFGTHVLPAFPFQKPAIR